MALTGSFLLDKSVLARLDKPPAASALMPYIGRLASCSTVLLEVGWSATSARHYHQMMGDLGWYELLDIDQRTLDLAIEFQQALVKRGRHRAPGHG